MGNENTAKSKRLLSLDVLRVARRAAPGFAHAFGNWAGPLSAWLASAALLFAVLKTRSDAKQKR